MVINLIFVLALATSSIYVFPSGLPQPADFIFVLFIFLVAASYGHYLFSKKRGSSCYNMKNTPPYLWCFIVLVFFVCAGWAIKAQSPIFFRYFLFYLYNAILVTAICIRWRTDQRFKAVLIYSFYLALIVSGVGVITSMAGAGRTTGFFNNPNQLAFYSLLAWACVLVLTESRMQASPIYWLAFFCAVLGVFGAASLGAMVGFFLLTLSMVWQNFNIKYLLKAILPVGLLLLLFSFLFTQQLTSIYSTLETRLVRAESKIADVTQERNYDRIFAFPEYIILGAGEGEIGRFYPHDSLEIHSTPGTLLFSYGLVGTLFFTLAWAQTLRRAPLHVWFIAGAPMLYSMTHMGLRTSLFWILLALIWCQYRERSDIKLRNTT